MQRLKLTLTIISLWLIYYGVSYAAQITISGGEVLTANSSTVYCAPRGTMLRVDVEVRGTDNDEIKLYIDWGDDSSDILTYGEDEELEMVSNGHFTALVAHDYEIAKSSNCTYPVAVTGSIGDINTSSAFTASIIVWGEDNQNGGLIKVNPDTFYVCVGEENVELNFADKSIWNCTPVDELSEFLEQNDTVRWTQWVYGTQDQAIPQEIKSKFTFGSTKYNTEENYNSNTGYPVVKGSVNNHIFNDPDYSIIRPQPPYSKSNTISILKAEPEDIGREIHVTLYNWNICNPYPDSIPLKKKGVIKIVSAPEPKIIPNLLDTVCASDGRINLHYKPWRYIDTTTISGMQYEWSGDNVINNRLYLQDKGVKPGTKLKIYLKAYYDEQSCVGYDSIVVYVADGPEFAIEDDTLSYCYGNSLVLSPGKPNLISGASNSEVKFDYDWRGRHERYIDDDGSPAPTFIADKVGYYDSLDVSVYIKGTECFAKKDYYIYVDDLDVSFEEDTIVICSGEIVELSPFIPNEGTYSLHYSWNATDPKTLKYLEENTNQRNIQFTAREAGTYKYIFSATNTTQGGCTDIAIITVIVNKKPDATIYTTSNPVIGLNAELNGADSDLLKAWDIVGTPSGGRATSFIGANTTKLKVGVVKEGEYVFSYTVTDQASGCISTNQVAKEFMQPLVPKPKTFSFCGTSVEELVATRADYAEEGGYWSEGKSNPSKAVFGDKTKNNTSVRVNVGGNYTFYWVDVNRDKGEFKIRQKDSAKIEVTFMEFPEVKFNLDTRKGCTPLKVKLTNLTEGDEQAYSWKIGDAPAFSAENAVYTFVNKTQVDKVETIRLTISKTSNGKTCSAYKEQDVEILPNADAILDGSSSAACSPVNVEFENKSLNAASYNWHIEYDDNDVRDFARLSQTIEGGEKPFTNESEKGEVKDRKVRLVAVHENGCSDTITQYVTVAPSSPVTFTMDKNRICTGEDVEFKAETGAVKYDWDFGDTVIYDQSRLHFSKTFLNTDISDVTRIIKLKATTSIGCDTTFTDTLLVRGNIKADFSVTPKEGVKIIAAKIKDNSANADSVRWIWGDRSEDSIAYNFTAASRNLKHFYLNESFWPVTYNINQFAYRYYDYNLLGDTLESCIDHHVESIEITPKFKIDFEAKPEVYCSPAVVHFNNTSQGASKFVWNFGDGTPKEKTFYPVHEYEFEAVGGEPRVYKVTLVGQSSWRDEVTGEFLKDSVTREIKVYPTVFVGFDAELNEVGDAYILKNTSEGAQNYRWTVDGAEYDITTTPDDFSYYIGENNTSTIAFNASLTAMNLFEDTAYCISVEERNIKEDPNLKADFIGDTTGCSPLECYLRSTSSGAIGYTWIINDIEIKGKKELPYKFLNESYTEDDTVMVTLIARGVKTNDTISKPVIVKPTPKVSFELDTKAIVADELLKVTNTSDYAESYNWTVGANTTTDYFNKRLFVLTNGTNAPVTKMIKLVANTGACRDTIIDSVYVYPKVMANIICDSKEGCSPLSVHLKAECENADNIEWDINGLKFKYDTDIIKSFNNGGDRPVKYYIKLTASSVYGVEAVDYDTLIVYPSVELDYTYTSMGLSPFNLVVDNSLSKNADSYFWNFGSNDTVTTFEPGIVAADQNFINNSRVGEDYQMSVIASNKYGCYIEDFFNIRVYPELKADFIFKAEPCTNDSVIFINKSLNAAECTWKIGDLKVVTTTQDSFLFVPKKKFIKDTTFNVLLLVKSHYGYFGDSSSYMLYTDTISKNITIYATPEARIVLDEEGNNPKSIKARALVSGADYWQWDIGNGRTVKDSLKVSEIYADSTITDPVDFFLKLKAVSNNSDCPDVDVRKITIYPHVEARFEVDFDAGCTPLTVNFINLSDGADTYWWDFGNGRGTSTLKDPESEFINYSNSKDTIYNVVLTARSAHGITDKYAMDIRVYPKPYPNFEFENEKVCPPDSVIILNYSKYYNKAIWHFAEEDNLEQDSMVNIIKYGFENNTPDVLQKKVLVTLSNEFYCDTTIKKFVKINPSVEASFSAYDAVCSGTPVEFFNTSLRASRYVWNFADSTRIDKGREPVFTFTNKSSKDSVFNIVLNAYSPDSSACFDTDTHKIVVYPEPDFDLTVKSSTVELPHAIVSAYSNLKNYKDWNRFWTFGNGDYQIGGDTALYEYNNNDNLSYDLRLDLKDTITGCSYSDSLIVIVLSEDVFASFSCEDTSVCAPGEVQFVICDTAKYSFARWEFGDNSPVQEIEDRTFVHSYVDEGIDTVTLIVFDKHRIKSDTFVQQVTVHPSVEAFIYKDRDRITSLYQDLIISAENSHNANQYLWTYADKTSAEEVDTIQFYKEGRETISLLAKDSLTGCYGVDTTTIFITNNYNFKIPNAFVPSRETGDTDKNYTKGKSIDVFYPLISYDDIDEREIENIQYSLQIYNRWGQMLFESKALSKGWDGYYNGKLAPQDVYVYRIKVVYPDGSEVIKTGDVTLLR